jgi:hypothetical protein
LHDQRRREAKRLGGLEVDHELEFCRLHDRQIGGLTRTPGSVLSVFFPLEGCGKHRQRKGPQNQPIMLEVQNCMSRDRLGMQRR